MFPLPVFILPKGITRLRIFEPRYLKMVKIATKSGGFAIMPYADEKDISSQAWASWVEIINFDQADDGMLTIDVQCKKLVKVHELSVDEDNLRFGNVSVLTHWTEQTVNPVVTELSDSLQLVFDANHSLSDLYQTTYIDDPIWVVARWLELVPVSISTKQVFAEQTSYDYAKDFIESIIFSETSTSSDLN